MSKHKQILALHRAGVPEKRYICPFPDCGKVFTKQEGKPDCCPDHRRFITDWLYVNAHVKPATTPGGIVIPDRKAYDRAVRAAVGGKVI